MRQVFIGPIRFWLLWPAVVAALALSGQFGLHTRMFAPFVVVILVLAGSCVAIMLAFNRGLEQVTREPYTDTDP